MKKLLLRGRISHKTEGFTLIEMLVVVAIIGLLSSIVVIGLGGARSKARDAKRLADVQQIINFAEVNYTPVGGYPTSSASGFPKLTGPLNDPYRYEKTTDGQGAKIGVCVENVEHQSPDTFACPSDFTTCTTGFKYCQATGEY